MMRSSHLLSTAAVCAAVLTSGCQTAPADEYTRVTAPVKEYVAGSRIPRVINPRTGRADTPDRVHSFRPNPVETGGNVLNGLYALPWMYR